MQYDVNKVLADNTQVELQWHGEDTRVLVHGEGEKTEVKNGGKLTVSRKQAAELLGYSPLWTLAGDEPTKQPYLENLKRVAANAGKKGKQTAPGAEAETDLSESSIAKMNKTQLKKELKKLGATFNDEATNDELRDLLTEVLAEKQEAGEEQQTAPGAEKHIVTQEDLDNNPGLAETGVKVGDEIELPPADGEAGEEA